MIAADPYVAFTRRFFGRWNFAGMDARHLAFPDATFDTVLLSFALYDMPRKVRTEVLREAARVAREKVVILDYDIPGREPWHTLVRKGPGLFETPYLQTFAKQGGAKGGWICYHRRHGTPR